MNQEEFARLVRSLAALPRESEWVELTLEGVCMTWILEADLMLQDVQTASSKDAKKHISCSQITGCVCYAM